MKVADSSSRLNLNCQCETSQSSYFMTHISIQKYLISRLLLQPEILNEDNKQNLFPMHCGQIECIGIRVGCFRSMQLDGGLLLQYNLAWLASYKVDGWTFRKFLVLYVKIVHEMVYPSSSKALDISYFYLYPNLKT